MQRIYCKLPENKASEKADEEHERPESGASRAGQANGGANRHRPRETRGEKEALQRIAPPIKREAPPRWSSQSRLVCTGNSIPNRAKGEYDHAKEDNPAENYVWVAVREPLRGHLGIAHPCCQAEHKKVQQAPKAHET